MLSTVSSFVAIPATATSTFRRLPGSSDSDSDSDEKEEEKKEHGDGD